jgi:hypothetical protein
MRAVPLIPTRFNESFRLQGEPFAPYIGGMKNERIFFADAELPFHVWVREKSGNATRWVLRDARLTEAPKASEPTYTSRPQDKP